VDFGGRFVSREEREEREECEECEGKLPARNFSAKHEQLPASEHRVEGV
jgi:hypothetical protein